MLFRKMFVTCVIVNVLLLKTVRFVRVLNKSDAEFYVMKYNLKKFKKNQPKLLRKTIK